MLTVPVDHCTEAYGLVLRHQHGWKIVFSGDTRPCPALIEAGKSVFQGRGEGEGGRGRGRGRGEGEGEGYSSVIS